MAALIPSKNTLLTTDIQGSLLHVYTAPLVSSLSYTAYGYSQHGSVCAVMLGFSGQKREVFDGYLLGSYRAYIPSLMRFNAPDNISPFGAGGINAYGYCGGDPINRTDRSGHNPASRLIFNKTMNKLDARVGAGHERWSSEPLAANALMEQSPKLSRNMEKLKTANLKARRKIDSTAGFKHVEYLNVLERRVNKVNRIIKRMDEESHASSSAQPSGQYTASAPPLSFRQQESSGQSAAEAQFLLSQEQQSFGQYIASAPPGSPASDSPPSYASLFPEIPSSGLGGLNEQLRRSD